MPAPKYQPVIALARVVDWRPVLVTMSDQGWTDTHEIGSEAINASTVRRAASKALGINTKGMTRDAMVREIQRLMETGPAIRRGPDRDGWSSAIETINMAVGDGFTYTSDAFDSCDKLRPNMTGTPRILSARFAGTCHRCGQGIAEGESIWYAADGASGRKMWHERHGSLWPSDIPNDDENWEHKEERQEEDERQEHKEENRKEDERQNETSETSEDESGSHRIEVRDLLPADKLAALEALGMVDAMQALADHAIREGDKLRAEMSGRAPIVMEVPEIGRVDLPELHHEVLPDLVKWLTMRAAMGKVPTAWLYGPAGTGKSTLAEQAAEALGVDFVPVSVNEEMLTSDLLGFTDANGRPVETDVERAYRFGGMACLDEVDGGNANVLNGCNMLLAGARCRFASGTWERHPNFFLVATANTNGNGPTAAYSGRCRLDGAFLNRFSGGRFHVAYSERIEMAMVLSTGLDASRAARFYAWAQNLREHMEREGLNNGNLMLSPRDLEAGALIIAGGGTPADVEARCWLASADVDTATAIRTAVPTPGAI